jgi:hypothetical protein
MPIRPVYFNMKEHHRQHPMATGIAEMETCVVVICAYSYCHLYPAASREPITVHIWYHICRICIEMAAVLRSCVQIPHRWLEVSLHATGQLDQGFL